MSRRPRPLDVAIVGMACRFPGACDLVAFWENLLAGRQVIRDVPPGRWDPAVFFDPDSAESDRVGGHRGGYLDEPIALDPAALAVMPRTVEGGEPEQFLVLDAARAALADAGLPEGPKDGRRVEVVVGRGNYFNRGNLTRLQHGRVLAQTLAILRALHPEWTEAEVATVRAELKAQLPPFEAATIPGQLTNTTAGRTAHRLDLHGPCYVVDAASASSLVALDLGGRAVASRRADLAIVGGVYIEADVDFPMVFSRLGVLSRSGRARPFAADADGMVPGEGVGVVVLKRLADAERDGDRVYAVLKGVGLASDGRGRGLATPSARGHLRAIRRAYRDAGIDPATVGLVEGHGLGVPAADRAELRALCAAFPPAAPGGARRVLGAASALIGHAMTAAGMAGLIKAALALHHRVLPASPGVDVPHLLLARAGCPLALNPAPRPWIQSIPTPRRAGVNAFGFAGINAHALLEEHAASADGVTPGVLPRWPDEAILLAAPDRAGLVARARDIAEQLRRRPEVDLKDLAFTLNDAAADPGRPARLGLVVASVPDLIERLDALGRRLADPSCRSIRDGRGAYFWDRPLGAEGRLAFLFPGEGSQYPGMLADLCLHFPEARALFDTSDRLALESGAIEPPSGRLFGSEAQEDPALWATGTAVNVVLSSQWALYGLLRSVGLRPDAVAGHSSGEFLALAAAGAVRVDRRLEERFNELAAMFARLEVSGAVPEARLVVVAAGRERVEAAFGPEAAAVAVAVDNCPHQVVLVGPDGPIAAVVNRLRAAGLACEDLPFARAYHTPAFAPVLGPVRAFFEALEIDRPATALYSCCLAGRAPDDPAAIRRLAEDQWTRTVEFRRTVEAMYADGLRLFVDVGARGNLAGFVEDILRGRPAFAVAANLPRRSGLTQFNHLVASLFAQGLALAPGFLYARRRPERLDLDSPPPPRPRSVGLKLGFPEMALSQGLVERLRDKAGAPAQDGRSQDVPITRMISGGTPGTGVGVAGPSRTPGTGVPPEVPPSGSADEAAMLSFLGTMRWFLETQRRLMGDYLERSSEASSFDGVADGIRSPLPQGEADCGRIVFAPEGRGGVAWGERPRDGSQASVPVPRRGDVGAASDQPRYNNIAPPGPRDGLAGLGPGAVAPGYTPPPLRGEETQHDPSIIPSQSALGEGRGNSPGPWAGEVRALVEGREVVAVITLDAAGDPVAEHHTFGGRRLSAVDPELKGLPVLPFTVMAEMLAEVAARLMPGSVLVGLRDVRARRWIRYEDTPIALEVRAAADPTRPGEVRAALYNRGPLDAPRAEDDGPDVEGVAVFAAARPEPPGATPFDLEAPEPSRFTAESMYAEQWLFHGPALRAVVGVGSVSERGIEGLLRVLPRRGLLRDPGGPQSLTDPIVLDAFTHLLGLWGLDRLAEGDVIFPLRLGELEVFGADPPEGSDVACRIAVRSIDRHRVTVDAEIVRPDGRAWMRINRWEDWRFYWPPRYRDVFRQPDRILVGEPLDLPDGPGAVAVWLEPPADMGRPVWRDVLEQVQLSVEERAGCLRPTGPEGRRTQRLWGRIAAKEAARRLWLAEGGPPVYPADLTIAPDAHGRPVLRSRLAPERSDLPAVSIAHAGGVAIALAARDPSARVGIDLERVVARGESFEALAFSSRERAHLDGLDPADLPAWIARLWCAKEAAAKATGLGLVAGPASVEVRHVDPATGQMVVALGPELAGACPDLAADLLDVSTALRGEYAWAWILKEGPDR